MGLIIGITIGLFVCLCIICAVVYERLGALRAEASDDVSADLIALSERLGKIF